MKGFLFDEDFKVVAVESGVGRDFLSCTEEEIDLVSLCLELRKLFKSHRRLALELELETLLFFACSFITLMACTF